MTQRLFADHKWSPWQRAAFIGFFLGSLCLAFLELELFFWVFSLTIIALYSIVVGAKVLAALCGVMSRFTICIEEDTYRTLSDEDLPIYTILLPVYKESAVVEKLLTNIGQMDYPKDKLDVKILLELDDTETLEAVQAYGIPEWAEVLLTPDEGPKTKPRACNYGLAAARGEYVVIYDAEDQPEPDQLKKVTCAYRDLPASVVCLQAKLNFFNARENYLTRCFSLEYMTWFDLYLPGLHAIGAPIPLGGTSNHFKTETLKELGGWDPYNVTEDCDLGIIIAEAQYATRIIDSVTWEEAPNRLSVWLGQRSRWIKGYFQTFWVHSRKPFSSLKHLGLWGFIQMLICVGGQVATVCLNPICWLVLLAWIYLQWPIVYVHSSYTLVLFGISIALFQFNILFMFMHFLAAVRRKRYVLSLSVLLLPLYWMYTSIGAWRGVLEFFWSPYKWVKTEHGLTEADPQHVASMNKLVQSQEESPSVFIEKSFAYAWPQRLLIAGSIAGFCLCMTAVSIIAPHYFGHVDRVIQARIDLQGAFVETEQVIERSQQNWSQHKNLNIHLALSAEKPLSYNNLRLMYYMKLRDGEWFHYFTDDFQVQNNEIESSIDLDGAWESIYEKTPWSRAYLHRVRAVGARVYYGKEPCSDVLIVSLQPAGAVTKPSALQVSFTQAPQTANAYDMCEVRWRLNKYYKNPFDSDEVRIDGIIKSPDGTEQRIPAFYTQDYIQTKNSEGEQLQPNGEAFWALRFAPKLAGQYTWHLSLEDSDGLQLQTEKQTVTVQGVENHRGFVCVGENPRYFAFENGEFFYPIAMNLRSPRDEVNHDYFKFSFPKKADGSYVMYDYLQQMKDVGVNMARVWMSPWFGGLEWNAKEEGYHGLGVYNLQNAYRLDTIIERAQDLGLYIEFALNHHGPFTQRYDSQWSSNPYNKALGGPAATPRHVLTDHQTKTLFKKRLRYVAARYGAYHNLFAYVLWIEANVVDPREPVLNQWHKEFGPYMKEIDANRHLVSTEFNNNGYPRVWKQEAIEYTQIAGYNFGKGLLSVMEETANAMLPYQKPAVLEEYMGLPSGGSMPALAHEFHDGLWAGWMMPYSSTPMPWWWNFIFEKNIHKNYTVFADFIEGEDLSQHKWTFVKRINVVPEQRVKAMGRVAKDRAFYWIYREPVSNIKFRGPWNSRRRFFDAAYRSAIPKSFSAIDSMVKDVDMHFMDIKNAQLTIDTGVLQAGDYQVEIWNTWRRQEPQRFDVSISSFPYQLALPDLGKDVAIKLIKEQ